MKKEEHKKYLYLAWFKAKQEKELAENKESILFLEKLLDNILACEMITFDNNKPEKLTYKTKTLLAKGVLEKIRFLSEEIRRNTE